MGRIATGEYLRLGGLLLSSYERNARYGQFVTFVIDSCKYPSFVYSRFRNTHSKLSAPKMLFDVFYFLSIEILRKPSPNRDRSLFFLADHRSNVASSLSPLSTGHPTQNQYGRVYVQVPVRVHNTHRKFSTPQHDRNDKQNQQANTAVKDLQARIDKGIAVHLPKLLTNSVVLIITCSMLLIISRGSTI